MRKSATCEGKLKYDDLSLLYCSQILYNNKEKFFWLLIILDVIFFFFIVVVDVTDISHFGSSECKGKKWEDKNK